MKYSIEVLQDKLPASIYKALKLNKAACLLKATMEEVDKAKKVLDCAPPAHWVPVSYRKFTEEEIQVVDSCVVVDSMFGQSVQFNIKDEESPKYIPVGDHDRWITGQKLSIHDLKIVTLRRREDVIYRIVPIDAEEKTYFVSKKVTPEEANFRNKLYGKLFCMLREIKFEVRDGALNVFSFMRLY